jgi:tRNA threonylcarbamoyladenosine biosynthesis protein TsaB
LNCLAIDASTQVLGLCARKAEKEASATLRNGMQHAPALLPLVRGLLDQLGLAAEELQLVVCSIGPGSFTGIRIGMASAQGISLGAGCPVVGVSTLDAFALPYAGFQGEVYPVIDARKGKYYTALFVEGKRRAEYLDLKPEELAARLDAAPRAILVGPDAEAVRRRVLFRGGVPPDGGKIVASEYTDPRALLRLGLEKFGTEGEDPSGLVPLYLRRSEAEIAAGRAQ